MTICKDRGWSTKRARSSLAKKRQILRADKLAGYVNHKSLAPMGFNDSCNTKLFENWAEELLIKELKPGQYVVVDNAAFHKSFKTKELIESLGGLFFCHLTCRI